MMTAVTIRVTDLDTHLLRGLDLERVDPDAYSLDWSDIVNRVRYAAMAGQHGAGGARWTVETTPVALSEDVWTVITELRLCRYWAVNRPCGVIERIEISIGDDQVIVAAVPAGPNTTDQMIRLFASRPAAMLRVQSMINRIGAGLTRAAVSSKPPRSR